MRRRLRSRVAFGTTERNLVDSSTGSTSRSWPCPQPAHFAILVVHAQRDVLLQLSGALDLDGADAFGECVAAAIAEKPRRVVLELSGLAPIDLVGAACFRTVAQSAEAAGVQAVLDSPHAQTLAALHDAGGLEPFFIR
jgi:anti-anti-sigma factor